MMRPSARIWVAVHASSGIAAGVKATVTSAVALISPVSGRFGPSGSLASILIVVPFLIEDVKHAYMITAIIAYELFDDSMGRNQLLTLVSSRAKRKSDAGDRRPPRK